MPLLIVLDSEESTDPGEVPANNGVARPAALSASVVMGQVTAYGEINRRNIYGSKLWARLYNRRMR